MTAVDANILFAWLNRDHAWHRTAAVWMAGQAENPRFVLCELCLVELYGLLRNPAVVKRPLDAPAAVRLVQGLRSHPQWELVDYPGGLMNEVWPSAALGGAARRRIPWSDLAIREIERARDLWAACQFDAAGNVLRDVGPRVPHRLRFEAIAGLAEAMAGRHRLDFRRAKSLLDPLQGKLPPLFDGRDDYGLIEGVRSTRAICDGCAQDAASEVFLRELLDNSLRTASQGRYEDAAARLYRAMEMQGQLWLEEICNGLFLKTLRSTPGSDLNSLPLLRC